MNEGQLIQKCTALLLNKIYLPTTFLVDICCSFRVISRAKCVRTDIRMEGLTDKSATLYSPFGEYEYYIIMKL